MSFKKPTQLRRITILSALAALLMCSSSWAATYYVDPNGNDTSGNGSSTSPWKTLSTACSKVTSSGNTIYLNAGTYSDNNRCNLALGVNIQGAGKTSVLIKTAYNGGWGTGYIFRQTSPSAPMVHGNNEISGFTLDGSSKTLSAGIFIRGTDQINIHDIKFQSIKNNAIWLEGYYDWSNNTMVEPPAYGLNDIIHDVETNDTTTDANNGPGERMGAINIGGMANAQLYNLTINENLPNRGTGVKSVPGWLKNFKAYNWTVKTDVTDTNAFVFEMYNFLGDSEIYASTYYHTLSLNGGPQSLSAGSSWNLKIHDTVTDLTNVNLPGVVGHELSHNYLDFYNNYMAGIQGRAAGLWSTNYTTGSGVTHWRFRNNVVYNCGDGLHIVRGNNSYVEIYNNVFDTITAKPWGGSGIDGSAFSGSLSGTKIQNNLIMNTAAAPISIGGSMSSTLVDHNWFYNTGNGNNVANSSSSTTQTNNTKGVAPQFSSSGVRPDPYYRSTSGNLVDAGVNVGLPYSGQAPDIGAYEGKRLSAPVLSLN